MSKAAETFAAMGRPFEADPEYITHGLLCEITDGICRAMEASGITRRELAERLGVSPQYITKFLNTPQNTSIYQAVRIATAVGLKLEVLLTPQVLAGSDPVKTRRAPARGQMIRPPRPARQVSPAS